MIGVVKNQFAIGVVFPYGLGDRFCFELRKISFRFISKSCKRLCLGKVVEIFRMLSGLITLAEQINRILVSLLLDAHLGQVLKSIVISREQSERLLQTGLRVRDFSRGQLQVADLA